MKLVTTKKDEVQICISHYVNHPTIRATYRMFTKHSSRPMSITLMADSNVRVQGRATQHQLGLLIKAIIEDQKS